MDDKKSGRNLAVERQKKAAAYGALEFVQPGDVVGVGSGSTVAWFVEALAEIKARIDAAVPSSKATETLLRQKNIPILDLNTSGNLPLYVDGADEIDPHLHCIKGGGGALTREKIIAQASHERAIILSATKGMFCLLYTSDAADE